MIFYLHYILLTSGLSGTSVLLGVFFNAYSDASQGEIGVLLMTFPVVSIVIRPLFCSLADRHQAHRLYLIIALVIMLIGYVPYSIVPFFPSLYMKHPRVSWYLLAIACLIGNGALAVAWSLGDTLAVNNSQRTKTPYSRVRLMGTISWGIYGYIIGQINETPCLPKYVPAFVILNVSVLVEIALLICWREADFMMFDPTQDMIQEKKEGKTPLGTLSRATGVAELYLAQREVDSTPSSLGGTLRLSSRTPIALKDIIAAEDLTKKLKSIEAATSKERELQNAADANNNNINTKALTVSDVIKNSNKSNSLKKAIDLYSNGTQWTTDCEKNEHSINDGLMKQNKNPQIFIFRLILKEDGRLVKYLALFCMYGVIFCPMNFFFISLVDICKERGYNFSQLAGSVLISQATIEAISFLVLPWFMVRVSRQTAFSFGLFLMVARFFFYATVFFNDPTVSPYWALIGEWGHGISYGIFCTIMADLALRFATQSKLFFRELRAMGYMSRQDGIRDLGRVRAEEQAISMALRATMQAVFSSFLDGLGSAIGNLLCGVIVENYSYVKLWQVFTLISVATLIIYQLVEVTRCRFSDSYKPEKGSKAFEIMSMDSEFDARAKKLTAFETTPPNAANNISNEKQQIAGEHCENC